MFTIARSVRATTGRMSRPAHSSMRGLAGKQKRYSVPSAFRMLAIAWDPFMVLSGRMAGCSRVRRESIDAARHRPGGRAGECSSRCTFFVRLPGSCAGDLGGLTARPNRNDSRECLTYPGDAVKMRLPGGNPFTRRRKLFGWSQHTETPRRMLIELSADGLTYEQLADAGDDFPGHWDTVGGSSVPPPSRLRASKSALPGTKTSCRHTRPPSGAGSSVPWNWAWPAGLAGGRKRTRLATG